MFTVVEGSVLKETWSNWVNVDRNSMERHESMMHNESVTWSNMQQCFCLCWQVSPGRCQDWHCQEGCDCFTTERVRKLLQNGFCVLSKKLGVLRIGEYICNPRFVCQRCVHLCVQRLTVWQLCACQGLCDDICLQRFMWWCLHTKVCVSAVCSFVCTKVNCVAVVCIPKFVWECMPRFVWQHLPTKVYVMVFAYQGLCEGVCTPQFVWRHLLTVVCVMVSAYHSLCNICLPRFVWRRWLIKVCTRAFAYQCLRTSVVWSFGLRWKLVQNTGA